MIFILFLVRESNNDMKRIEQMFEKLIDKIDSLKKTPEKPDIETIACVYFNK
jgi:hypothetical protein